MHLKSVPGGGQLQPHQRIQSSLATSLKVSDAAKQCLNQLKTVSGSPTPSNFSLQNYRQRHQKHSSERRKGISWDKFQELCYFDAILRFVIENPYLTVSWTEWKPTQYYNFIAQKMAEVFGEEGRKPNQLKTKDQNLKKEYYTKRTDKTDLVEVALQKVTYFVNKMKKFCVKENKISEKVKRVFNRCDQTLKSHKELMEQMKRPKQYEIELCELTKFIESSRRAPLAYLPDEAFAQDQQHPQDDNNVQDDKHAQDDKQARDQRHELDGRAIDCLPN